MFESEGADSLIKLTDFKNAKVVKEAKPMKRKLGGVFYLAPEVIKGNYNEKCDVWSCGVILYIILCGYPPFSGNTDEKIEEKILAGEVNFKGNEWRDVSTEAKDFLRKLLEYDPIKRITAEEALKDDWFILHARRSSSISDGASPKPSKTLDPTGVKKIIYEFLINNQNLREDNLKLREIFEGFDKDQDYHLTWESLVKCFDIFKKTHNDKIGWIDSLLDSLVDDTFNYNEILMLIYNKRIAINKENFERALNNSYKDQKALVSISGLVEEFKKEKLENNDEWTKIMLDFQKKGKTEEIKLKDLKDLVIQI